MFGGEAIDKKVKVLSGGEKTRLAMIRLLLEPVNLLILDEPTNHLDMRTKDILKQAIKDFDGTVIVVSHDREFLDGLVEKVYEFGGGQVRECLGGIYEFLEKKKLASLQELERNKKTVQTAQPAEAVKDKPQNTDQPNAARLSYQEKKERDRTVSRAEKKVAGCETDIARIEAEIAALEETLASPESVADTDLYTQHATLRKQLENAMSLWELASMELDELKEKYGLL